MGANVFEVSRGETHFIETIRDVGHPRGSTLTTFLGPRTMSRTLYKGRLWTDDESDPVCVEISGVGDGCPDEKRNSRLRKEFSPFEERGTTS